MDKSTQFRSLAEEPKPTRKEKIDSESCYRRGYCHGIVSAIRELKNGRDLDELCDSAYRWRRRVREDDGKMTTPPGDLPLHKRP